MHVLVEHLEFDARVTLRALTDKVEPLFAAV